MLDLKPELETNFAADFRDGEAMAREWIAGRGDLPGLLHIVRDMPRRDEMGGLEAGFLSAIDAASRGDQRGTGAPDPAEAQLLLEGPPLPSIDIDEFHRRQREHQRRARFEELARNNSSIFTGSMPRDSGWGRF